MEEETLEEENLGGERTLEEKKLLEGNPSPDLEELEVVYSNVCPFRVNGGVAWE